MRTSTSSSHVRCFSGSLATAAFSSSETRRSRKELEVGEVAAEAARGRRKRRKREVQKGRCQSDLTPTPLLKERGKGRFKPLSFSPLRGRSSPNWHAFEGPRFKRGSPVPH